MDFYIGVGDLNSERMLIASTFTDLEDLNFTNVASEINLFRFKSWLLKVYVDRYFCK